MLQTETAVQWSHFLQACEIRPPNREWIWLAIEELAAVLGYDASYFEEAPEPELPEPELSEERPPTERDVLWARLLFYGMHETVHGYRPDGVATITNDMDEVQRFLTQLSTVIANLPATRQAGSAQLPGGAMPDLERGIRRLFRYHDALPEVEKEAIEREWQELASALYNYTEARQYLRSLYERMAGKLAPPAAEVSEDATTAPLHRVDGQTRLTIVRANSNSDELESSGEPPIQVRQNSADRGDITRATLPTLPTTQDESSFVGPVQVPEESHKWAAWSKTQRIGLIAGTIVSVATTVVVVMSLVFEPQSVPNTPIVVTEQPANLELLVTDDFPTCESTPELEQQRPAAIIAAPKRRKASKYQFVRDTDSVVINRKNKPNLKLTVTEVAEEEATSEVERTRTLDVESSLGLGVAIPVDESLQVTLEIAE